MAESILYPVRGGVWAGERLLRPWRSADGQRVTQRCRAEQWYLVSAPDNPAAGPALAIEYVDEFGVALARRSCVLATAPSMNGAPRKLAWVLTPPGAASVRVGGIAPEQLPRVVWRPVAERDPKCHPIANVPRWSLVRPALPLDCVFLPESLAALTDVVDEARCEIVAPPRSLKALLARVQGGVCVLDPAWVSAGGWGLRELTLLASACWLLTDLETLARAGAAQGLQMISHYAPHEIMSARVAYSDVATRGFALQDVLPYCWLDERGEFRVRGIRAGRSWRRFADGNAMPALLTAETPWEDRHGDVLMAAASFGPGEWIACDLPWHYARSSERLIAPLLARHLTRMLLARPLPDHLQYWNRWDDDGIVLRDISDLEKRYAGLRVGRFAPAAPGVGRFCVSLSPHQPGTRHLILETGRIDQRDWHGGVAPEPMCILMKWLARERNEQTAWWRSAAAATQITWVFESAEGLRFATGYPAAAGEMLRPADRVVRLRMGPLAAPQADVTVLPEMAGVLGDGALQFQDQLTHNVTSALPL